MQLLAIIKKELLLIAHDLHGLLLLFAMPALFILIMSLALQGTFDKKRGIKIEALFINTEQNPEAQQAVEAMSDNNHFTIVGLDQLPMQEGKVTEIVDARESVLQGQYMFLVYTPEPTDEFDSGPALKILAAPNADPLLTQLFINALHKELAAMNIKSQLNALAKTRPQAGDKKSELTALDAESFNTEKMIELEYNYRGESRKRPTSVQQNVPAWLVFGMFFITIPLSNTFIQERISGTARRIQTLPVASWKLVVGKLFPYFCINQLQVIAMLAVGVFLVPLAGGDKLEIGDTFGGLAAIAAATSFAALGISLLISSIVNTSEQAVTLGAAANIILAAIGGVMVPTFVMPEFMQTLSAISPMAWGLQGFLDILLRSGGIADVLPEVSKLLTLGAVLLGITIIALKWRQTAHEL